MSCRVRTFAHRIMQNRESSGGSGDTFKHCGPIQQKKVLNVIKDGRLFIGLKAMSVVTNPCNKT